MPSHFPLNFVCSEVKEDEDEKDEDEEEEDGENQETPCIRISMVTLNNQGWLFLTLWYAYGYGCLFVGKLSVISTRILDLCFYITDAGFLLPITSLVTWCFGEIFIFPS